MIQGVIMAMAGIPEGIRLIDEINIVSDPTETLNESAYVFLFTPLATTADVNPNLRRYLDEQQLLLRRSRITESQTMPTIREEFDHIFDIAEDMIRISSAFGEVYPDMAPAHERQRELWMQAVEKFCDDKQTGIEKSLKGLAAAAGVQEVFDIV